MARTSTRVKVGALKEALKAKRDEIVTHNQELDDEVQAELATLADRQIVALEDAISAALDGKIVRVFQYSGDKPVADEYMLDLPTRPWRSRQDTSRYDQALRILDLADPEDFQVVPHDGDYAKLLNR